MSEIEELKRQLEDLKRRRFGAGSTFTEIGEWMLEIGKLNISIAELMLEDV